jgi:hypothetical protein
MLNTLMNFAERSKKIFFALLFTSTSMAYAAHTDNIRSLCDQTPVLSSGGDFLFCSSDGRVSFFQYSMPEPFTSRQSFYAVDNTSEVDNLHMHLYQAEDSESPITFVGLQKSNGNERFVILHEDGRYDVKQDIDHLIHREPDPCAIRSCL